MPTEPMSHLLITISAIICLFGSIVFILTPTSFQLPVPFGSNSNSGNEPFSLAAFYAGVPYTSSWQSWWHPQRVGASTITKGWNILYHLGGNGPWVEKVDGIVKGGVGPPNRCKIEQIHMMSRHAERFPTIKSGARMLDLMKRIRKSKIVLKGELEFVNDWEYFTDDPSSHLEQLTTTGPFAGTLEAFTTGVKLRTRYNHLINQSESKKTQLWASDCNRVIDTARYFSAGFFGLDWEKSAKLNVIPETDNLGADTLTPGDTCIAYRDNLTYGHDYGVRMLMKFRSTYLGAISDRLEDQNPGIRFDDSEVYSMQEMCGFETTVRGSSKWCDVFSHAEWLNFEYARDVIHYYRGGPGNPWGPLMGWLWLNATTNLLNQGPSAGPLYFTFVHDGDIVPMIAALGIFSDDEDLPVDQALSTRTWRTSQITPMGGRIIFERLACSTDETGGADQVYVRINVNDGIVAIPGCKSGPGKSCPLDLFVALVARRGEQFGDFREKCHLSKDAPDRITFLHQ